MISHDTKPHPQDENDDMEVEQSSSDVSNRDNSFRQFRRLCEDLEKEPSYNAKTKLVSNYIKYGNSGGKYIVMYYICACICMYFNITSICITLQMDLQEMYICW